MKKFLTKQNIIFLGSTLVLLFILQWFILYAVEQYEAKYLLRLGKEFYEKKEFQYAALFLEIAAKKSPSDGEANYYLGKIAMQLNKPDVALEQFEVSAENYNRPYLPLREIGYLKELKLQQEIQKNPNSPKIAKLSKEVQQALTSAINMNPVSEASDSDGDYALVLAEHYHQLGLLNYDKDQKLYAKYMGLAWKYFITAEFLGTEGTTRPFRTAIFFANIGFWEMAMVQFWQAVLIDPEFIHQIQNYLKVVIPNTQFPELHEKINSELKQNVK